MAFFGAVVSRGAIQAIREFGGYAHVHCFKQPKEIAATCSLELKITLKGKHFNYLSKIDGMDTEPWLYEELHIDGAREVGHIGKEHNERFSWPTGQSVLMLYSEYPLYKFLTNVNVFRFEPLSAKEPNSSSTDATMLDSYGRNVATVLSVMEKKQEFREQILEWLELLVPGIQSVYTQEQRLDGSTVITFKEEGTASRFPARLISDVTIYAL